ncbi:tetratricopeptide repeat-containing sulfotransferase family protein [Maricaulis sp.]|uniref:tetratricopeptide repeat-containing sulfotransferase family protein n=1 Tax=Maricaulis sp. TaxID=1486257 RepID=UPI00260BE169|nr:tetratricopeptide repeat-containing sulfotransferase family protein [Maricaulis sp.]
MSQDPDLTVQALKTAQTQMYEGRFDAALETVRPILDGNPDHTDALYVSAVCARYLKQWDEAQAHLARIRRTAPEFGRAHQEEGHLLRDRGETARALLAYQRACQFNPALLASWRAQAELLAAEGRQAEARQARGQADRIAALPQELVAVTHLLYEGKLLKAEQLCRAFLQKTPHHIEAMRLLAEIGTRFGVLEDADFLLESAIEFEPDNTQLRLDYIQVLRKRQKFEAALEQARHLYESDPANPIFQSHFAIESMQTGEYERALELFDTILAHLPEDPATLTSRGHALKTMGRHDEAVASYRKAFAVKPDHGDAYYALANLKTYVFTDGEIAAMREQEASADLSFQNRIHLCFALGKAFEDRGEYDAAFEYYERGNDLKRVQTRYTSEQMAEELQAQASVCTADLFEKQGGKGCEAPDPIFIVGLPRAGSTLLEQILASHSQVDGTLELPNILALSHRLRGRKRVSDKTHYPRVLFDLTAEQLRTLGEDYIENTRIHRQGAPFFTDKMPNNFRHIGLIKLILPDAKIIDARREPMACCFSGFKQLFAEGQEFTYGLDEIGRYYRGYVELMDHWNAVLPGQILRVHYEDVVADLETQVRRILDFCGLEFEQACLDFHTTERAVRTASSEQVRQPIYQSGVEQWRHFEDHLDPLKQALGPALETYRSGA